MREHQPLPAPAVIATAFAALLLPTDTLYDCDRSDVMYWRREGDSYEPPDESEGAAGDEEDGMIEDVVEGDDEATGGTVSLQQLASG